MEYSAEQLNKIDEYAGLLMTITDIAILLNIDEDELRSDISDNSNNVYRTYRLSKIRTTLELHRQEIELAKLGSPLSIELTQKYIIDQKLSENG